MNKLNSNTQKITTISLFIFLVLLIFLFIYGRIQYILAPLSSKENINEIGGVIQSEYMAMEVVDIGTHFTIYRDINTDILYMNLKNTGYSSSLSVIYDSNGQPLKYSDFNK